MTLKPTEVAALSDPVEQMVQAHRSLVTVQDDEVRLAAMRGEAILKAKEEGHTDKAIARMLGLKHQTIRNLASQARKRREGQDQ